MKTRLMMFVAVIALFVFNGCSDSKESYVKDFKKFIEKVEAAASTGYFLARIRPACFLAS